MRLPGLMWRFVHVQAMRAYPPWFRRRYGAASLASFDEGYRAAHARRGAWSAAGFAVAATLDALRAGLAERRGGAEIRESAPAGVRAGGPAAGQAPGSGRSVSFFADLRFALGAFRRQFRLSIAAALCIAIGIAATTAVVTLIDLTVFEPLPFPDADRLVRVWNQWPDRSREELSWPGYEDLAAAFGSLECLEASARSRLIFIRAEGSRRVEGEAVTAGYFDMLGIEPFAGRLFTADEHAHDAERVMVLSYAAWGAIFQHDPDVVGTRIRTNNQGSTDPRVYTVIGVIPPSFIGTIEEDFPDIEFWVPAEQYLYGNGSDDRSARFVLSVGTLAAGTTLEQAREELAPLSESVAVLYPEQREELTYRVEYFGANWREGFQRGNVLLLAAAGLLLAVAAANVSGLLLARTTERRHELAVRVALGATRAQIARQLLMETLVVVAVGGAFGLWVARWILEYFVRVSAVELPGYMEIAPDAGAMALSTVVIALTGLAAGLLPALAGARTGLARSVQEGSSRVAGSRRGNRSGRVLVVGEVTLTVVLVVCSGLLLRSYASLASADLGFRTDNLLRMALFIDPDDVPADALPTFYDRLRSAVLAAPHVETATLALPTLPVVDPIQMRIRFLGMPEADRQNGLVTGIYFVDTEFFEALEIPLLAGRGIEMGDGPGEQAVMVVGRSLAERMGGIERAVGTRVGMDDSEFLVVGVAENTAFGGPAGGPRHDLEFYGSIYQSARRIVSMEIITRGEPLAAAPELRRRLAELAPSSAVDWVDDIDEFLAWTYRDVRFFTLLVGVFTASALALTGIGLYAILSNLVARSTMELGVRKSFGATAAGIMTLMLRRGLTLVGAGLTLGLVLAVLVARSLEGFLFGIQPFDAVSFAAASAVVLVVAVAASVIPARRAAAVQPGEALRG